MFFQSKIKHILLFDSYLHLFCKQTKITTIKVRTKLLFKSVKVFILVNKLPAAKPFIFKSTNYEKVSIGRYQFYI